MYGLFLNGFTGLIEQAERQMYRSFCGSYSITSFIAESSLKSNTVYSEKDPAGV